jgi:hypothetical protein
MQIPPDVYFHFSFVGGGGLFPLLLGKGIALQKYLRETIPQAAFLYSGISSGCFCALLLALRYKEEEIHQIAHEYLIKPFEKKWYLIENFAMWYGLKRVLRLIVGQNGYKNVRDKLRIGISEFSWEKREFQKKILSQWKSSEHLVNCILTSCHIFILGRQPLRVFDRQLSVDGGFTCDFIATEDLPLSYQPKVITFRLSYDQFPKPMRNFQHALPLLTQKKWNHLYATGKTFFDMEIQPSLEKWLGQHEILIAEGLRAFSFFSRTSRSHPLPKPSSPQRSLLPKDNFGGLFLGWVEVSCAYVSWGLLFIWRFILNNPF